MKINNVEIEDFDFLDADNIEKVEFAFKEFNERNEKLKDVDFDSTSKYIREQCHVIFDFFNAILGDGADKKIFGNKTSLTVCVKAVEDFISAKTIQENKIKNINAKYLNKRK